MVHIYYGDGKGKTTAAVGLAVRASGNGKKVLFTQFLKSDISGERRVLECIPTVKMPKLPEKVRFVFDLSPEEHSKYKRNIIRLYEYVLNNLPKFDVVVADEIFSAVDVGFITVSDVIHLISECPETTDLVLTGHNLDKSILVYADYVTCMSKIKHPYDRGISARQGVEY